MKIQIIPMTKDHLPAVAALEKTCFPADPWSEALFQEALENPRVSVLLAQGEDGAVLGYAVLSVILDEGNLANIAVARPARRRGGCRDSAGPRRPDRNKSKRTGEGGGRTHPLL